VGFTRKTRVPKASEQWFCAVVFSRASEFELLAETEDSPDLRLRYRVVAAHYRELAECKEKSR
jgi:hypothetical protein